jgi:Zn-finger nucleic acid-binding protein
MDCPRCNQPTTRHGVHGVPVERCARCAGMFLDRGDLNRVAEPTAGDLEFCTLEQESFQHADGQGPTVCPRCGRDMDKVEFNIYTGIILDHCAQCGGFWLDGDELARIDDEVRRLNAQADPETASPMLWFATFIWSLPR